MRILHIISSLNQGGAQQMVSELAKFQKANCNSVDIIVYDECSSNLEKELEDSNINIISLHCKNTYAPQIILKLRHYIKKYDLAHVHLFPSLYQVAVASIGVKTPIVYTEHSTYNRRRNKNFLAPVERVIYGFYNRVVSISEATQNALLKWLWVKKNSRFSIIYNGINIERFNISTESDPEKIFGRKGTPILMVSRFVESKDQETLIKSLKYIEDKDVYAVFAGDGEKLTKCHDYAISLGVEDRCLFLGNRSDIPILIHSCYIGVQASNWEGFGLTAVEFMACKKPIIASNIPGLSEIVADAGILFDRGDAKSLAKIVNKLIADREYYQQISQLCYERSLNFDIAKTNIKYLNTYKEIIMNQQ